VGRGTRRCYPGEYHEWRWMRRPFSEHPSQIKTKATRKVSNRRELCCRVEKSREFIGDSKALLWNLKCLFRLDSRYHRLWFEVRTAIAEGLSTTEH
jgi:hypothetical protein